MSPCRSGKHHRLCHPAYTGLLLSRLFQPAAAAVSPPSPLSLARRYILVAASFCLASRAHRQPRLLSASCWRNHRLLFWNVSRLKRSCVFDARLRLARPFFDPLTSHRCTALFCPCCPASIFSSLYHESGFSASCRPPRVQALTLYDLVFLFATTAPCTLNPDRVVQPPPPHLTPRQQHPRNKSIYEP